MFDVWATIELSSRPFSDSLHKKGGIRRILVFAKSIDLLFKLIYVLFHFPSSLQANLRAFPFWRHAVFLDFTLSQMNCVVHISNNDLLVPGNICLTVEIVGLTCLQARDMIMFIYDSVVTNLEFSVPT